MKKRLLFLWIFLIASSYVIAQESTMFAAYQQTVKPSMDASYRTAVKNLKNSCQQSSSLAQWNSFTMDDNTYVHFVPIKAFADLDKNIFSDVEGKVGKEAMGKMWVDMDKCVEAQTSYVMRSMPQLSYSLPQQAGENYNDVFFWYPMPGKEAEAEQIMVEWQKLYSSKKATISMVTYKIVFGAEPGYAIVSHGKDPAEYTLRQQKTRELLGEEAGKLWERTMAITGRYDTKTAWYIPDLSYAPAKTK